VKTNAKLRALVDDWIGAAIELSTYVYASRRS